LFNKFYNSFYKLEFYCEKENFKGYDPFDGLNSKIFKLLPFLKNSHLFKLLWIQFFKRSPINLRRLFGIEKDYNSKSLALFLSGYCNLYCVSPSPNKLSKINYFIDKILKNSSKGYSGSCWGYNFDWEARAFTQPINTPTIVASTFVANALLDAYAITNDKKLLDVSRSTCQFILIDINRTYDSKGNFSFSYSPIDQSVVYNASLLGAKLLSRVYSYSGEILLIQEAKKVVEFCCERQNIDGSWSYGVLPFHQWIDNFHTGYNLECIADYMKFSNDFSYFNNLTIGFSFYFNTFFLKSGIPKYYHNSIFPIDIHSTAQLLVTLNHLNLSEQYAPLINNVLNWTIDNMQSKKGYFYYQINKYFTSKIPYMRWSQAWMFYAFSIFFLSQPSLFIEKKFIS
jgi:hypothetical protein